MLNSVVIIATSFNPCGFILFPAFLKIVCKNILCTEINKSSLTIFMQSAIMLHVFGAFVPSAQQTETNDETNATKS